MKNCIGKISDSKKIEDGYAYVRSTLLQTCKLKKQSRKTIMFDDYDFETTKGKFIRVKLCAKTGNSKVYKFNSIDVDFKCDCSLFVAISNDKMLYRIFLRDDFLFDQKTGHPYVKQAEFKKAFEFIDKDIFIFFDLSLHEKDLHDSAKLKNELQLLNL